MRLWHKDLIQYLPKSQLLAQWKELNSIFKNQDKHILINYIYEYDKTELFTYSLIVIKEFYKRGYEIKSFKNLFNYFKDSLTYNTLEFFLPDREPPIEFIDGWLEFSDETFKKHQNETYLVQCYYNLKEKYDRGQKDFTREQLLKIQWHFGKRILLEVKRQLGGK